MPELPDLQVFARNLTKRLQGKKLEKVHVHQGEKLPNTEKEFNHALAGKPLTRIYRQGKQLYFDFGKDLQVSMHLMLHGKLEFQEEAVPKYAIASFDFGDEDILVLADFQKMANMALNPKAPEGMDALSEQLTGDWLFDKLKKSKASIKAVLMDQKIIGGIGNAYADEILWEARIDPQSVSNKIPQTQVHKLASSIREVLTGAEAQILKAHPDIISGEVRDFLAVHNSKKKTSPGGKEILNTKIGGRVTYYTEEQELYK